MKQSTTNKIEQLIKLEGISPQGFSRMMFGLGGFFNQLVGPDGDRAAMVETPLIRRVFARLNELEQTELARLRNTRPSPQSPEGNGPTQAPPSS